MCLSVDDLSNINDCIECEGFDYCFVHYTDFSDITDKKFHELRNKYLDARTKLADYIGFEE